MANHCSVCRGQCIHVALPKPSLVKKVQLFPLLALYVQKGYGKQFYATIRMNSSSVSFPGERVFRVP